MNKFNSFHALATPCSLIFLSNISNTDEVALLTNVGKTSLVKGTLHYLKFSQEIHPIELFQIIGLY